MMRNPPAEPRDHAAPWHGMVPGAAIALTVLAPHPIADRARA